MGQSTAIRVFVVEDHPVVRAGLRAMLESVMGIAVVGMVASGREAVATAEKLAPDVILLDLRIPEIDGIRTISALLQVHGTFRVVVLTNYHSEEEVFSAFRAGASAYLLKTSTQEEIVDTIRAVHAGEKRIPANVAAQLAERLRRPQISRREQEILALVARGLTNREIGDLLHISHKTARNHVINCLDKLGAKDRTELVTVAIRCGLIGIGDD
jgi:two-component system NarL family response regulator